MNGHEQVGSGDSASGFISEMTVHIRAGTPALPTEVFVVFLSLSGQMP
jgi:hypothetical protein